MFQHANMIKRRDVPDGLSKTICVGEVATENMNGGSNIWSMAYRLHDSLRTTEVAMNSPIYIPGADTLQGGGVAENGAFGSFHPGGAHFSFGDAHVSWLSDNTDLNVYHALSTRKPFSPVETITYPNGTIRTINYGQNVGGETVSEP